MTEREPGWRERAAARLHVVEGLVRALDMSDAVGAAVEASDDRQAAHRALQEPPFSFSEVQAHHVLDAPTARRTRLGRRQLEEEADELRRLVDGSAGP